jgi:hypothetical protein
MQILLMMKNLPKASIKKEKWLLGIGCIILFGFRALKKQFTESLIIIFYKTNSVGILTFVVIIALN